MTTDYLHSPGCSALFVSVGAYAAYRRRMAAQVLLSNFCVVVFLTIVVVAADSARSKRVQCSRRSISCSQHRYDESSFSIYAFIIEKRFFASVSVFFWFALLLLLFIRSRI